MAQFQYTAVNSAGKKLTGVISAGTEDEARKQLNTFGISLLSIEKTAETSLSTVTQEPGTSNELPKFEFEAYDKQGRKIVGTVPASSRYKAFERLVEEYQFEVAYVVPAGASETDREQAKIEGLPALQAEYDLELKKKGLNAELEKTKNTAFEMKRQELLKKVDFLLEKIKSVLKDFSDDITPEAKKNIQTYIDKLLRIKSSTNLDYIEHTSEEMLKKVQEQELFLTKERATERRAKLQLEAQKMMAALHSKPVNLEKNDIENLQKSWANSSNAITKWIGLKLKHYLPSAAEKVLQQKIQILSKQVWTYRRILWTAPQSTKNEARSSLQKLLSDRRKLSDDLALLKKARAQSLKTQNEEHGAPEPLILEEISGFLNWLFLFYTAIYFLSISSHIKTLNWGLPNSLDLLSSSMLRSLFLSVFIWTLILNLHLGTLKYQKGGLLLSLPLGLLLNFVALQNL